MKQKHDLVFKVEDQIEIAYFKKSGLLQVSWETSPKNDLVADSVCLLVLQIKENPTPQLVNMMDIAADKRQDQVFAEKVGIVLESHFDSVEPNYGGKEGYYLITHPHKGKLLVDSIGK